MSGATGRHVSWAPPVLCVKEWVEHTAIIVFWDIIVFIKNTELSYSSIMFLRVHFRKPNLLNYSLPRIPLRVQSGVNFFCGIKKLNNLGLLLYAFKLFAMFCLSKTAAHYFGVFSAFARFTRSAYVKSASHDSDFLSENGN